MKGLTQILEQIEKGDTAAAERLLPLVYEDLRKLAAARLGKEKPGQTLQATALVREGGIVMLALAFGFWGTLSGKRAAEVVNMKLNASNPQRLVFPLVRSCCGKPYNAHRGMTSRPPALTRHYQISRPMPQLRGLERGVQ